MVETRRITDPSLLQEYDITIDLSSSLHVELSKASSESLSQTQQTKLVLLQPLANAETLAACRSPQSRLLRKSDGSVCGTSNHEFLDIAPLSKTWRKGLMKAPPIPYLTFDLALPKEDEKHKGLSQFQKVYWDTAMPNQEVSLGVHARDIMTLVITIATETRMRVDGNIRFEVTYDELEGVSLKAMTLLKKQLLALAEFKAPGVIDGERSTKTTQNKTP